MLRTKHGLIAILVVVPVLLLYGNPSNPPVAKTGAPGDGTCAECHTGVITNAGRVIVDFGKVTYTPGVKQTIGVHVLSNAPAGLKGFQLTARMGSNELQQAGHFEVPTGVSLQEQNGIEYVNHGLASNNTVYTFQWTPPDSNVGNIRFYVAAVAGESNSRPDPNVYTAVYTITPATRDLPAGFRWSTFDVTGAASTNAWSVSNNGLATGSYKLTDNRNHGFIRDANGFITTFDVAGAAETIPHGINSSGTVVGLYINSTGSNHGFIRNSNGSISTFDVPGAAGTNLWDINDSGSIAGEYQDTAGVRHGLTLITPPTFQVFDIGTNTTATGINSIGSLAGQFNNSVYVRLPSGVITGTTMCETTATTGVNFVVRMNQSRDMAGTCAQVGGYQTFIRAEGGRTLSSTSLTTAFNGINDSVTVAGTNENHGLILQSCVANPVTTLVTISGTATTGSIGVTSALNDCRWNAFSEASWITIGATGQGNGALSYTVTANPNSEPRTGTIWLAGRTVSITQLGAVCDYTFTGGTPSFSSTGGTATVVITSAQGCTWNASSSATWLTFPSGFSGASGTALSYSVQPNFTNQPRSAQINVGTSIFTINQSAGGVCTIYIVSPLSLTVPSSGTTTSVSVSTEFGCTWGIFNSATWISVLSATGTGPGTVTLSIAANPFFETRSTTLTIAGQNVTVIQTGTGGGTSSGLRFVPITPCRVADTRTEGGKSGAFGPPRLPAGTSREFPVPNAGCGIPFNARAYSLNLTVVPTGYLGYVTAWATGQTQPFVSTLNSWNGRVVANAAIVPAGSNGSINVFVANETDVILDINGYFLPVEFNQGLAFYPVTPCRVADTRNTGGIITGGTSRSFNLPNSNCGIPFTAQAFSLNVTAVPPGFLGFLTVWPSGQDRPLASTLNSWDGQVVPNAALVPAGSNGAVSVFASNDSHVVIDVNGYFAPAGSTGALSFYTLNPCRVADTRPEGNKTGPFGPGTPAADTTREIPIPSGGCSAPSTARAYSLNVTAIPPGFLGFLTAFPAGSTRPPVSTLNSWNGQVVANAALVPAGPTGSVNIYVSNTTDFILDINGYFAP